MEAPLHRAWWLHFPVGYTGLLHHARKPCLSQVSIGQRKVYLLAQDERQQDRRREQGLCILAFSLFPRHGEHIWPYQEGDAQRHLDGGLLRW